MRRNRRVDPKSFDLTTESPECHYKVQPNEMMRLDNERMRCPNCKQDVLVPTKGPPWEPLSRLNATQNQLALRAFLF
jgi:hypothetical protein